MLTYPGELRPLSSNRPNNMTRPSHPTPTKHPRVAVIGESLGGLAAANVFVQLGWRVDVYERSPSSFEDRGAGLGFVDVPLWEHLRNTRMIRRGRRASRQQGAFYYGDLWAFLYAGLPDGTVRFGCTIQEIGDTDCPTVQGEPVDLVVVADGGWSKHRRVLSDAQPQYAGYVVYGGMVEAAAVDGFSEFGIFKSGMFDTIAMPLAKDRGPDMIVCGIFVATPEAEVERPASGSARHTDPPSTGQVPEWFLPLYKERFASQPELVRLMEAVVGQGRLSARPQYELGIDKVVSGRVVVVGDAAHMASPRTAVGAHTAILDAVGLREALTSSCDIDVALRVYSSQGADRAQALLGRSKEVSRQFIPAAGKDAILSPSILVQSESS